jgi:hypothetical protein
MPHITPAVLADQPSSQIVPHLPNAYTSTRPENELRPLTSLTYTLLGFGVGRADVIPARKT